MSYYDDYLNGVMKNLDVLYNQKRQDLASSLANRGINRSGISQQAYRNLDTDYMNQMGQLIPQVKMEQANQQQSQSNWEKQFNANQGNQIMQGSLESQRLADTEQNNAFQRALAERQLNLQNAQFQAQQEAYGKQQSDWWKPLLGQGAGGLLGMVGGSLISKYLPQSDYSKMLSSSSNNISSDYSGQDWRGGSSYGQ